MGNCLKIAVKVQTHTQTCIGVYKGTSMCDSVRVSDTDFPVVWGLARMSCFLGMFSELQKSFISFVMCLSVHMELLGSHWMDFHEIWHLRIFRKLSRKFMVH
jgi:hypothetical protein